MISKVYIIACDICKQNLEILKANSIGTAFKAAKKLPWGRNSNNTKHTCLQCIAKMNKTAEEDREGAKDDAVRAGVLSKEVGTGGK